MKKRIFSFSLVIVFVLSALLGCSSSVKEPSFVVVSTSSDLKIYENFLLEKLPYLPHNITLIVGNNNRYGIDLTSFEDDGYIIRVSGNDAVIAGKTYDGIDLACRYYVNETLCKNTVTTTVHREGYRIDRLELFNIPIEEYTVIYEDKTEFAASEFLRLSEQSCGAALSSSLSHSLSSEIIIRISDDAALGNCGFRIFESEKSLIIEGASAFACALAVYSFFEEFCGWDCLRFGDSCLQDANCVSVPKGISYSETPEFEYFSTSLSDAFITDSLISSISCGSLIPAPDVDSSLFEKIPFPVCISSEASYKSVFFTVFSYLLSDTKNSQIDLTPLFKDGICNCENCTEILAEENASPAGVMLRLANRLADDIYPYRPSAVFKLLIPISSVSFPVTVPHDSVSVTLDVASSCFVRPIFDTIDNNPTVSSLKFWSEITNNLYVRLSYDNPHLIRYPNFYNIREDLSFLSEHNVRGVFLNVSDDPFGYRRIECQLFDRICRDLTMSDDEYDALLCHLLEKEYGAGYLYIKKYAHDIINSGFFSKCSSPEADLMNSSFNTSRFADSFNEYIKLFDMAASLASTSLQESRIRALSCHMYYMGCIASYPYAFYSADSDWIRLLNERYSLLRKLVSETGVDPLPQLHDNLFMTTLEVWDSLSVDIPSDAVLSASAADDYAQSIASAYENISDNNFTFLFKTDSHYSSDSSFADSALNDMRFFGTVQNIIPVDLYVHGGDLINGDHITENIARTSIIDSISAMTKSSSVPFFPLRGNHDDNSWNYLSSGTLPSNGIIDTNEWRKFALSKTEGIVMGDGAYGYFDHEESKIRVLLVDTSDIPYEKDDNGNFKYSSYCGHGLRNDQLNFFAKALTFSDKGKDAKNWAVLVISHVPIETLRISDSSHRFGIPDAQPRNNFAFLRLLKAYQRGEIFNESVTYVTNFGDGGYDSNTKNDAPGDFFYDVFADFSANGPGEVIGFVCGHLHTDNYANNVGHHSYTSYNNTIYPELSDGYPYISISNGGFAIITVKRNYDGTGTVFVDRCGISTVPYDHMISKGDNAVVSIDPSVKAVTTSPPATGSVASGKYSIIYTQNP